MSIKDLLSKVERTPEVRKIYLTTEQVKANLHLKQVDKIEELSFTDLLNRYTRIRSWLETHECQTGTDNKLDVNDRPYNHEQYCNNLKELERVACEILSRPLTEGLEEQLRSYGL